MAAVPLVFQVFDVCARTTLHTADRGANWQAALRDDYMYMQVAPEDPEEACEDHDDAGDDPFSSAGPRKRFGKYKPMTKEEAQRPLHMCLFGKTAEGQNVLARVRYRPFLFVQIPDGWRSLQIQALVDQLTRQLQLDDGDITHVVERRKQAYGWVGTADGSQTKQFSYLRLRFPNGDVLQAAGRKIGYLAKSQNMPLRAFEWQPKFSMVHKFCDDQHVVPTHWVELPAKTYRVAQSCAGQNMDVEVEVSNFRHVKARPDLKASAPLVVASYDIECRSATQAFPNATLEDDYVIGIGTVVKRYNQTQYERHYFSYRGATVADTSRVTVHAYPTELEMLLGWRDFLMVLNPDVLVGYNINQFDFKYMCERANRHLAVPKHSRMYYLSKLWGEHTPLVSPDFSSQAYGDRSFFTFVLPGRLVLDLMEVIRREHKLRSYKLDDVSLEFLVCPACRNQEAQRATCTACEQSGKMHKLDLPPKEIFVKWEGSDVDRGLIAEYCSMDCELVLELMVKLCALQNVLEMSGVTLTNPQDIVSKGQQVKVLNQIIWYGHRAQFVINDSADIQLAEDGYEGVRVLDPHPGFYADPIATLDFASLYPSIMRRHNLCFSTWVNDPQYLALEKAQYDTFNTGPRTYTFVQHIEGILPQILTSLLAARKAVRKEMEQEPDEFRRSLLNARQLALKVSANSVYGFCGTGVKGKYPCLPVSDTTTFKGREMITRLKATIEEKYAGSEVIYGDTDSVMVKFAVQGHPQPVLESFRLGTEVCVMAHEMFGGVIELTMEKVFHPYLLLKKKRYAGLSYTDPTKKPKVKMSGVEAVRRDFALMCSTTYAKAVDALLLERSVEKATSVIVQKLDQLVADTIPFQQYVLSCQLKAHYKNANQLQTVVVEKMRQRAPGSEPRSGDRVQFVVIQVRGSDKAPAYKKVEDAAYAREHRVPLDRVYYLEKQLERPLSDLMEAFVPDPKALFDRPRALLRMQRDRMQTLTKFFAAAPKVLDVTTEPPASTEVPAIPPKPVVAVAPASKVPSRPNLTQNHAKRPGKHTKDPRQLSLVQCLPRK